MFTTKGSRQTKPSPGATIDWGHPLAKDLAFAVIPGADQRNLCTGDLGTLLSTGTWGGLTTVGDALESHSTTTDGAYWPFPHMLATATTRLSMFTVIDVDSTVDYGHMMAIPYRAGPPFWDNPYGSVLFHRHISTGQVVWAYAYGSSTRDAATSDATTPFFTTGLHSYGVVRNNTVVRFYFDGKPTGADYSLTGGNNAIDWGEKQPVTLLRHSSTDADEGINGRNPVAYIWTDAKTDADMEWIQNEKFAPIVRPVHRRYFIPAAGGGGGGLVTRKALLGVGV